MTSYEGIPLDDLKRYAAQRALPPTGSKNRLRPIKAQLEQADDEATFNRFSDLPPELRLVIYTYYFESSDYRHSATNKCQPPITRVSRQTRKESLPIFYECCEFSVLISPAPNSLSQHWDAKSKAWIKATPAELFGRIKTLHVRNHHMMGIIKLSLDNREDPVSVDGDIFLPNRGHIGLAHRDRLLSELRTLAMGIVAREGPLKLRKNDIVELYRTLRRSVRELP
jgi:hypothetical protein